MLFFLNDYGEGACETLLQRLAETNREPQPGYGGDAYCAAAEKKILAACGCPEGQVFFLSGGTQTNQLAADAFLRHCQGMVAADTGHVATHEAGAIEFTGHKVLPLTADGDGKLDAEKLEEYLKDFYANDTWEHMPSPGMVYISHPTEYGTLYTREELAALSRVCRRWRLPLYLDGARLGYALAFPACDVTLRDIAALCGAFYIGGTKVGALCGEALVFPRGDAPRPFLSLMKRHGALLAKGRLLGVQFDALFTDGLYWELGRRGIETAGALRRGLAEKGVPFLVDSPTNQIFVVLEDETVARLREKAAFSFWERVDEGHTAVRFVTSWATRPESVEALLEVL